MLIGLSLSNSITRPITQLVHAARRVAKGDLHVLVTPTSNDEIALLTNTFNQMITNLNDSKNNIVNSYDNTLEGWSRALELRDEETNGHTQRVITLMFKTAQALKIDKEKLESYQRGVLLHDIGKMGIPDAILNKPGKLNDYELSIMRRHPVYAYEMLKDIDYLAPSLAIPYCHHERWDGTGYPRGLKGTEIPVEARIFALVDAWDAITSDRPYRKAMSKEMALMTIRNESGTHFDPEIAKVFLELVS